jgi:hypothetical protein
MITRYVALYFGGGCLHGEEEFTDLALAIEAKEQWEGGDSENDGWLLRITNETAILDGLMFRTIDRIGSQKEA